MLYLKIQNHNETLARDSLDGIYFAVKCTRAQHLMAAGDCSQSVATGEAKWSAFHKPSGPEVAP